MKAALEKESNTQKQSTLLEEDISQLEQELSQRYYQLGKSMYEMADRKVSEINGLVDQLVACKIRLTQIREQSICSSCLTPNAESNLYCGHCGSRLQPQQGKDDTV